LGSFDRVKFSENSTRLISAENSTTAASTKYPGYSAQAAGRREKTGILPTANRAALAEAESHPGISSLK
jgi:hypothetical protein